MPASKDGWLLTIGNVTIAPILHGCLEFSRYVREAILELSPELIALELPVGLEGLFGQGVSRFPRLSYVCTQDFEEDKPATSLWRIEPTDPFCEAVRTAGELEIPYRFIDDLEPAYPTGRDFLPDPYSLTALGPGPYYKACLKLLESRANVTDGRRRFDEVREERMASRLAHLAQDRRVLAVVGLAHAAGLAQRLSNTRDLILPKTELRPLFKLYHPSLRTVRALAQEPPFFMALYEMQRGGPGEEETWLEKQPGLESSRQDDNRISGLESQSEAAPPLNKRAVFSSLEKLLGLKSGSVELRKLSGQQLKQMLGYLGQLKDPGWVPPGLLDEGSQLPLDAEVPSMVGEASRLTSGAQFFTFRDVGARRSQLRAIYEKLNGEIRTAEGGLDRQLAYRSLVEVAAQFYEENTGNGVKDWQFRNLSRFAGRYAFLKNKLLPDLLSMIYCTRACVDHNYAYEFWDLATFYPWQDSRPGDAPVFDFDGDNLEIDGVKLRHFQFKRTFPRLRQTLKPASLPKRAQPSDDPKDWASPFQDGHICSYPPEDVVIEDYGRYLQRKAIKVQSEAHSRTEPFTTSMLDGIDIRTTMRSWADGRKIYVREERKVLGGTGAVVLIFAPDAKQDDYPWGITWHGEQDQEADMAFYATDRRKKIIGPGIARCEYGGLMLSYPPRRLGSVWGDPAYAMAKTKAEVLLMAAIDYSLDKHVLYVAACAPRSMFYSLAQRMGKKLIYLPIGTLSPPSLERIRVFHVLAGHSYRDIAKNFLW